MTQPDNAVVVAVGIDGAEAAIEFAVDEARRHNRPVHLVHVLRMPATGPYADLYAGAIQDADAVVEQAATVARKLAGDDVAVTGERVDDGWVVGELVHSADRGRMAVLQHRRRGALHRLLTGSTTNGVAARAQVPVVSVPDDWESSKATDSDVTVAVQDTGESAWLLRVGFEQASARGGRLAVLHAWWLDNGYDVNLVDPSMRREREALARKSLTPVIDVLKDEFPTVEVAVDVRHAPPAQAVLDAAEHSDLVVLGRRHHLLPLGSHLGPVARATLHHSACPVLMVPSDSAPQHGESGTIGL
jgi:nucleotide-binding universal stress UspA family protein